MDAPPGMGGGGAGKKVGGGSKAKKGVKRKARKQVQLSNAKRLQRAENHGEFNIWYGKYIDFDTRDRERLKAETRCNLAADSGETLASEKDDYFCYHFARGCCSLGSKCKYLHRVPVPDDVPRFGLMTDCFGRTRFANHSDDMGGVGCFNKDCRTLYIGNVGHLKQRAGPDADQTGAVSILAKHFAEWGLIEEISFKPRFGCAFIRYVHRISAEFGKVAMSDQGLDGDETLNVRWAYDDPNPKAIERIKDEKVELLINAMLAKGHTMEEARMAYSVPEDYKHPMHQPDYDLYGYHIATGAYNAVFDTTSPTYSPDAAAAAAASGEQSQEGAEVAQSGKPQSALAAGGGAASAEQGYAYQSADSGYGYATEGYYDEYGGYYDQQGNYYDAKGNFYPTAVTLQQQQAAGQVPAGHYDNYGAYQKASSAAAAAALIENRVGRSDGPMSKVDATRLETIKKHEAESLAQAESISSFNSLLDSIDGAAAK